VRDKAVEDNVSSPTTVGELHSAVEALGPGAWRMFTRLWEIACEIPAPPENQRKQKPGCAPILATEPHGKPDAPLPPLPANSPLLEEGLHRALPEMTNPRAVAFLLHVPRDPPAWRYQESEGEKAERQALEDIGGWSGD
jgi:hypothetical protein